MSYTLILIFHLFHVLQKSINPSFLRGLVFLKHDCKLFEVYMDSFKNFKDDLFFGVSLKIAPYQALCDILVGVLANEIYM